jgi:hypothetical protein
MSKRKKGNSKILPMERKKEKEKVFIHYLCAVSAAANDCSHAE